MNRKCIYSILNLNDMISRFWYHLYGSEGVSTLNVWLRQGNQYDKILWSSAGTNLGDKWRYGHVTVQSRRYFQIALEGIVDSTRGFFFSIFMCSIRLILEYS